MKQMIITALLFSTMACAGQVTISGHVFNDANGLTDLQINGSGGPLNITNGLNIYLVDPGTNQILQAAHNLFDAYSFSNVPENTAFKLVMSWRVQSAGDTCMVPALPNGWLIVGENLGAGLLSGSDHQSDGILNVTTDTTNMEEANFAIKQYP